MKKLAEELALELTIEYGDFSEKKQGADLLYAKNGCLFVHRI
ncbi:MAG: hypothetical protein ACLURV_09730 [Gallintestinimicrobium sp.]